MPWAVAASVAGAVVTSSLSDDHGANAANSAASDASAEQARTARLQQEMSQEQWNHYKSLYEPLEQQYASESQGIGSIANQNKSAQQAAADVAAGFAGARENLNETPGLNPNSDAYLRAASRTNLSEAATSAAAQTGARQQVKDRGRAAMTDVLSLGKGLPANASTMLSSAGTGFGSAASFAQRQALFEQQQANAGAGGIGRAVGGLVGSKGFKDWINSGSTPATPIDTPTQWQNSPMAETIYGNGSLGD